MDNKQSTLTKYGPQFQSKCIVSLLYDIEFVKNIYDILNINYFESESHKWIVNVIMKYFEEFKELPTIDVFNVKINDIKSESEKNIITNALQDIINLKNSSDSNFIKAEFLNFCKTQKIKQAVLESVDLLSNGKYEEIGQLISTALKSSTPLQFGHDYKLDVDKRLSYSSRKTISTGWKPIDELMDGGLAGGELGVVTACSGAGKCVDGNTLIIIKYNTNDYIDLLEHIQLNDDEYTVYENTKESIIIQCKISNLFTYFNVENKANVFKHISNVRPIKVKSYNDFVQIHTIFRTEAQQVYETTFKEVQNNGVEVEDGNTISIKTSRDHLLHTTNKGWVRVGNLSKSDIINGINNTYYKMETSIQLENDPIIMYDMYIDFPNCYFTNNILSHNSWLLAKLGTSAMLQGKNVFHISLELNEEYTGLRYDTCFTHFDFKSLKSHSNEIKQIIQKIPGKLFIKYFPSESISPLNIRFAIEKLQIAGFDPDIIIIDYADILRPTHQSYKVDNYNDAGKIYSELRCIAGEMQKAIWTASQQNRSALDKEIIGASSIADSSKKINIADFVMSLSRLADDKIRGTGRVHIIKNRFGFDGLTFPVKLIASKGEIDILDPQSNEGMMISSIMMCKDDSLKSKLKQANTQF